MGFLKELFIKLKCIEKQTNVDKKQIANNKEEVKTRLNEECIAVLLKISEKEYDDELGRIGTIDTKASIAVPIIAAYFLTIISQYDLATFEFSECVYWKDILRLTNYAAYVVCLFFSRFATRL